MIHIEFDNDKENRMLSLNVYGHAGAGEYGKDIICASASVLVYTLANNLNNIVDDDSVEEDGHAFIRCKANVRNMNAFKVIQVGFELLAEQYPQNVELKKFGETLGSLE